MQSLQICLLEVQRALRYVQHLPNDKTERRVLKKHLMRLHEALRDATPIDQANFVDQNLQTLRTLHKVLATLKGEEVPPVRHHIFQLLKGTPEMVSILFRDFMQGITIFSTQTHHTSHPVYHRKESCGPFEEQDAFRKKHSICMRNLTSSDRKMRRATAERCYIERLVYDEMYNQLLRASMENDVLHHNLYIGAESHPFRQDPGHEEATKQAENDFKTCCQGCRIEVEVEFGPLAASVLTIQRFRGDRCMSTETYVKDIVALGEYSGRGWKYGELLDCFKTVGEKQYLKVQGYDREEKWRKTAEGGRRNIRSVPASKTKMASHVYDTIHSI